MLRGEVTEFAQSITYCAALIAFSKKYEGVRSIAMGNSLRRLATKVGAQNISAVIGELLRPVQFMISFKGTCEPAAHAASRYLGELYTGG